jgi:hypothetical protein
MTRYWRQPVLMTVSRVCDDYTRTSARSSCQTTDDEIFGAEAALCTQGLLRPPSKFSVRIDASAVHLRSDFFLGQHNKGI